LRAEGIGYATQAMSRWECQNLLRWDWVARLLGWLPCRCKQIQSHSL